MNRCPIIIRVTLRNSIIADSSPFRLFIIAFSYVNNTPAHLPRRINVLLSLLLLPRNANNKIRRRPCCGVNYRPTSATSFKYLRYASGGLFASRSPSATCTSCAIRERVGNACTTEAHGSNSIRPMRERDRWLRTHRLVTVPA